MRIVSHGKPSIASMILLCLVVVCLSWMPQRHGTAAAKPRVPAAFIFVPAQPLMDDVVHIRLSGLPPRQPITIKARMRLAGRAWRSRAVFVSDARGSVDLGRLAPVNGSYAGVDPMGLFWAMKMDEPASTPAEQTAAAALDLAPVVTRFEAESSKGRSLASAELTRRWAKPGVRVTDVREGGLVGRLFEPAELGRHPGVIVLSGSEGGTKDWEAALLASRGYAAFALAYFKSGELPEELVNIPLEYLKNGLDWFRARGSVNGERVAVMGASKGAELALVLGATFPEIKAVVAYAPTSAVGLGIDRNGVSKGSSWTYRGKPLPCMTPRATPAFTSQFASGRPVRLRELHKTSLENKETLEKATIPVENIHGAVLLISGGDDQMGPSSAHGDRVISRLRANKHPYPFQHLSYKSAGHGIYGYYIPTTVSTTSGRWALGGTPAGNANALADSRPKVLQFLRQNLGK